MKNLKFLVLTLLLVNSCQKDDDVFDNQDSNSSCQECGIETTQDETRLEIINSTISLSSQASSATSRINNENLELVLKAKLAPLVVDYRGVEKLLNANHVTVKDGRVAASYSIVGEPYGGAIDIIDIPNGGDPSLDGTLLIPNKDIDYVAWNGRKKLMFGGGLDVDVFSEATASSNFEYYAINDARKNTEFSLERKKVYNQRFGNKLNRIGRVNGLITGSGGGNQGNIFVYDINDNRIYKDDSNRMSGLFILDFTEAKVGNKKLMAVMAFDNSSKELKLFYFEVKRKELKFKFDVSLGNWDLNVEAKHSIHSPKKNILMVSLEQDGIGVFKLEENNGVKSANLLQQLKSEILNPINPDEVVNSFSYSQNKLWVAAGAAGVLIVDFDENSEELEFKYRLEVPGESVNSILKDGDNLVVASTSGVRIYDTN